MRTLLICMLCAVTAYAQYDSPTPPRIQIPGAIIGGRQGGFRQGRLQAAPVPNGVARIRRPGLARPSFKSVDAAPRPSLQSLEEQSKPVTEEPEDEIEINTPTAYVSNAFSTAEPQNDFYDITTTSQPKPPAIFNSSPFQQTTPTAPKPEPVRPTQYRPLLPQSFSPVRNEPTARPQPARLQPLSSRPQRPAFRPEPKPFVDEEDDYVQPVRQYSRPQEPVRAPAKSAPAQRYTSSNSREKKPVAQIIRKYREENEDGSITWGFENDDGSFKEEVIGVDCITRGKYGYVDPDGLKREYNYETGIACDKAREDKEQKGFIDYQENKAVLPNGITIDLAAMGKKSKRPFRSASNH
ncbi:pollen-specific leucine-rich repeat extensin-like protein 1 [Vanessa cardui]|uniref:pollen-specific leucine-rich repeat extensin-like protein 1 n=1 Tax=Vanessa cardui TaxID=171605 RepID=UPI001F13BDDF|nr:pollen-specific leucine-rich repeat extensin-like protein 1 [Vanessa cardui]